MLKNLFKKTPTNTEYTKTDYHKYDTEAEIPKGLWKKCNKCGAAVYTEDVISNYYVCPKCNGYFRVHAYRRIQMVCEADSFEEWDMGLSISNPLKYVGYEKKIDDLRNATKLDEAIITGKAMIGDYPVVIGVMDARFMMGSMGHVVGEKIARAVEGAILERLPVILFTCSGGARMQEGIVSLMQMAKTSAALKRHSEAGLLYVPVLTDPTTGGVTASFAMLGDIILAEPHTLIGFAGPRVIEQTIKQKLPEGFQRSEFLLEHGFVDAIVERENLKATLEMILMIHSENPHILKEKLIDDNSRILENNSDINLKIDESNISLSQKSTDEIENTNILKAEKLSDSKKSNDKRKKFESSEMKNQADNMLSDKKIQETVDIKDNEKTKKKRMTAWERVKVSRMPNRPTGMDYIERIFNNFIEFHGDRYYKDDGAIVGGVAFLDGQPVTVIAQQKGKNTKDNIKRNFGMVSPDGYRKALRLMKQAEKFHRPIICFVDTPGAFCGLEAEERGQGEAIARNLFELSALTTPILSIVIGEGGSGGALAMAVADEVWMLENSIYSILSPEGFASILWKDSKRADEAAKVMKITAKDLKKLKIIEKIIEENEPANMKNVDIISANMKLNMREFIEKYTNMETDNLVERRYNRFRNI